MIGRIHNRILCRLILALPLLCYAASGVTQANTNTVTGSVQPAQVTVGNSIIYRVTIVLTGSGQPSVAVPVIDPDTGLSTPSPAGTQSSVETYIMNGNFRSVQKTTYNYSIRTSKEGTFTIPPFTVTMNGKTFDTEPIEVQVHSIPKATNVPSELEGLVVAPDITGNPELQRKLTGVVFVLPVVSTTEPYNGEQVRISYHLVIEPKALTAAGLQPRTNLDGVNIPPMNEFITEELYPFPQDLKFQEREIGGKLYLVAPVYEAVISSTKSGELKIDPFRISMIFSMRDSRSRARTPFANDPFFSSLSPLGIMGGNSVQVIAQSPQLTLNVKPVPQTDRPEDFAGAVGSFTMQAEVDKKQAKAYDETIGLDVTIEGEGNTDSLSPPDLPAMPGFTVLGDPEQKTSGRKDGDNYISAKKFSYTLRPTSPGNQTIPPIEMSYFEPKKQEFVKVATDPISLKITPGANPVVGPAPVIQQDEPDAPPASVDLRYVSTERLSKLNSGLKRFRGLTGIAIFLIPPALLVFAGAISWARNRARNHEVDPHKLAKNLSAQHLKDARHALDTGDTRAMSSNLADGVRLYFASKFEIPVAEMTIPEIEKQLIGRGASPELISRISRLLEICDSAQYGPASASGADAHDTYNEAMRLLKETEAYS